MLNIKANKVGVKSNAGDYKISRALFIFIGVTNTVDCILHDERLNQKMFIFFGK